jgi:hypothetical protein
MAMFPDIPCILIVNFWPTSPLPNGVRVELYSTTKETQSLFALASKKLDHNFRDGFWKYTFERLFALQQYHEKHSDSKILHIESDVLLLPEFPWKSFAELNSLAWLNVNETHDVAALVYLPNPKL